MEQPPKPEKKPTLATISELEAMLEQIDSEIVGVGENISNERLDELTKKKGQIARWIAQMKGEHIDPNPDTF